MSSTKSVTPEPGAPQERPDGERVFADGLREPQFNGEAERSERRHIQAGERAVDPVRKNVRMLPKAPAAPEPKQVFLDAEDFESDGFRIANPQAKDQFDLVVLQPGYVFPTPGIYRNIHNIDEVIMAEPGDIVPEGLKLVGENYLVEAPIRKRILGR